MAFTSKLGLVDQKFYQPTNGTLTLSGTTCVGIGKYLTDKSSCYSARWIPDVAYVTGETNTLQQEIDYISGVTDSLSGATINSITGATNGLTKTGRKVKLGGSLTGDTSVTLSGTQTLTLGTTDSNITIGSGNTLIKNSSVFGNTNCVAVSKTNVQLGSIDGLTNKNATICAGLTLPDIYSAVVSGASSTWTQQKNNSFVIGGCAGTFPGAQYNANYCANFTARSLVDKGYVTDVASGITGNYVCAAENGIHKRGNNTVSLGGSLTGDTTITAGADDFNVCGTNGNLSITTAGGATLSGGTVSLIHNGTNKVVVNGSGVGFDGCVLFNNKAHYVSELAPYTAQEIPDAAWVTGQTHNVTTVGSVGEVIYRDATRLTGCTNMIYCDSLKSFGFGVNSVASGNNSGVFGGECNTASASDSGVFAGETNVADAACSAIFAGNDNKICSNAVRSAIIGGQCITLTGATYSDTVAVDCLAIMIAPATAVGDVLTYQASTGKITKTTLSSLGGLTGATNGIGTTGQKVCLGGALVCNTKICGAGLWDLCLGTDTSKLACLCTFAQVTDITSGSLSIASSGATFTDLSAPGTTPSGIVYATDYSNCFCNNSLVTKKYVDSIATGLIVKGSVVLATTGPTTLSGVQTIDGMSTSTGMRVLVKDQASGATNGIYIAGAGAWTRATDFNGVGVTGEVANGDLIPVTSGNTQNSTIWVLTTPNPIIVGTTALAFSEFSTVIDVQAGQGIAVTQSGGVHTVCVLLPGGSGAACGLAVSNNGLCINSSIASSGLTYNSGILYVNAASGGNISAIPVKLYDNCLVVNCGDIITGVNAITGATNGLTETCHVVCLGGNLIKNTTVSGNNSFALNLCGLTGFTLGFGQGDTTGIVTDDASSKRGLQYAGDYSGSFCDCSLISKLYADQCDCYVSGITLSCAESYTQTCVCNCTITANNGLYCYGPSLGCNVIRLGGCLTEDTTVDGNGTQCLNLCGLTNFTLGFGFTLTGGTGIVKDSSSSPRGLQYFDDYSLTFCNNSLVTKSYVLGHITGGTGIAFASNGLTKVSNTVILGGALTGTTTINGGQTLRINESEVDITGSTTINLTSSGVTLQTPPPAGANTDKFLVWNSSDKCIKQVDVGSIISASITGATNGLTKRGQNATLGGTLTGDTTIDVACHTFNIHGAPSSSFICITESTPAASTITLNSCAFTNICGQGVVNISTCNKLNITASATTLQTTPLAGVPLVDAVLVWNATDKKIKTVSGAALGDKNNVYTHTTQTGDVTLGTGDSYVQLVNGGAMTITLPASPIDGEAFKFKDISGNALVNNITIDAGAGKQIDNAQTGTINTDFGALEIMYSAATSKWYSLAFVN